MFKWFEGTKIIVPIETLLRITNALTLAHLELSASRREIKALTTQVQNLQTQLEEAQETTKTGVT